MKNKLQKILFQYNWTQESENKIEKFFKNEIKLLKKD